MKVYAFLLALLLCACHSSRKEAPVTPPPASEAAPEQHAVEVFPKDSLIARVSCSVDGTQNYALFLPSSYADSLRLPVIIFLDPQGDGTMPINKYRALARKHGAILLGSNTCKNGMTFEQTTEIIGNLAREATLRWNARNICLAGFSGGAKAALYSTGHVTGITAVAYCGAAIPFDKVANLPPVLGFSGIFDMNYFDTWNAFLSLHSSSIPHAFVEWKGKHEWPPTEVFEDAFSWFDFMAMRSGIMPHNDAEIAAFRKQMLATVSSATSVRKAMIAGRAKACLDGLADIAPFSNAESQAFQSPEFRQEMQQRKDTYVMESNLKNNYLASMESKDANWWMMEIQKLRSGVGDPAVNQRLIGYISLAAYTYSKDAVTNGRMDQAWKYLSVYKIADPENPEQPYLQACYFAKEGDNGRALISLQKALSLGFKDMERMETEPALQALRSTEAYHKLVHI